MVLGFRMGRGKGGEGEVGLIFVESRVSSGYDDLCRSECLNETTPEGSMGSPAILFMSAMVTSTSGENDQIKHYLDLNGVNFNRERDPCGSSKKLEEAERRRKTEREILDKKKILEHSKKVDEVIKSLIAGSIRI